MFTIGFFISLSCVISLEPGGPMLKVPNRTQRSKGFKVKHFIQACLLLAVCVWLLNQVKHYYEKTTVSGEAPAMITQRESVKLGRKDLDPNVQASSFETKTNVQTEESTEHESETKGGDDDDGMDGHDDVEKTEDDEPEEVEDLIDEEDREKEDEVEEEEEEDHGQYESQRKSRKAREENYKGDDASSDVVHNKEKMFDRKDDQTSLTDSVIDSSSNEVAENEKGPKSERNARLLLMENLSVS